MGCCTSTDYSELNTIETFQSPFILIDEYLHIQRQAIYWYSITDSKGYLIIINDEEIYKYHIKDNNWIKLNSKLPMMLHNFCVFIDNNLLYILSPDTLCTYDLNKNQCILCQKNMIRDATQIKSIFVNNNYIHYSGDKLKGGIYYMGSNTCEGVLAIKSDSVYPVKNVNCIFSANRYDLSHWVYVSRLNRIYYVAMDAKLQGIYYIDIGNNSDKKELIKLEIKRWLIKRAKRSTGRSMIMSSLNFTICLVLSRIIVIFCHDLKVIYLFDVMTEWIYENRKTLIANNDNILMSVYDKYDAKIYLFCKNTKEHIIIDVTEVVPLKMIKDDIINGFIGNVERNCCLNIPSSLTQLVCEFVEFD